MVRNDRRTKLLPKIILGQLCVGIAITIVALSVVFYAQGYRFDENFNIRKTGVIFLNFTSKDVKVEMNEKVVERKSNFTKNVAPGFYDLTVSKEGYVSWQNNIFVETESVNVFEDIILFKDSIIPEVLTDNKKIELLNQPTEILAVNADGELSTNGYEILIGDKLVTRFSDLVSKVVWYPDLSHIIYQQGNQIRIMEKSGMNDTLLFTLNNAGDTIFAVGNRGEDIYYKDGDTYYIAKIR